MLSLKDGILALTRYRKIFEIVHAFLMNIEPKCYIETFFLCIF